MSKDQKGSDSGRPITITRFPGEGWELTKYGQHRVVTSMTRRWVRTIEHGRQNHRVVG